jgi:transposase
MFTIALDSHKRYSQVSVETMEGQIVKEGRIQHQPGAITQFLQAWPVGTPVAVETVGNWYWIVDEIEQAGMVPKLVHARKAKLMFGSINKTDKLDARGLNQLQRCRTLPTVWIPPGTTRDLRELPRLRMSLSEKRTQLKNRIHSALEKYGLICGQTELSDLFGKAGRQWMEGQIEHLPEQTRYTIRMLLELLDQIQQRIDALERRMRTVFGDTPEVQRLMTLPGIGWILSVVIAQEIGDIGRFASPERLASYSGMTPRIHQSGAKCRIGSLRSDVNHYLKWAYSEAGNSVALNHRRLPQRHVSQLYGRIRNRRGHAKAVGAVGRHLAEASYWVLTRQENYREPSMQKGSSTWA